MAALDILGTAYQRTWIRELDVLNCHCKKTLKPVVGQYAGTHSAGLPGTSVRKSEHSSGQTPQSTFAKRDALAGPEGGIALFRNALSSALIHRANIPPSYAKDRC